MPISGSKKTIYDNMYKMSMTWMLLVMCVAGVSAKNFTCYSCNYQLSADPTVHYNCVNDPQNVTQGAGSMPCNTPNQCITITTFSIDRKTIRSTSRSCHPQSAKCDGESCCNEDGVYDTCEHKCRDDLCNDRNPERWLKTGSDVCDDCNSAGCITTNLLLVVITMFMYMCV